MVQVKEPDHSEKTEIVRGDVSRGQCGPDLAIWEILIK